MPIKNVLRMMILFLGAGGCAVLGDNMPAILDKLGLKKEDNSNNNVSASIDVKEHEESNNNGEE